jgi:hypothetical protein
MQQQAAGREGGRAGDVEDKRKAGRAGDVEDKRKAGRAGDVDVKRAARESSGLTRSAAARRLHGHDDNAVISPTTSIPGRASVRDRIDRAKGMAVRQAIQLKLYTTRSLKRDETAGYIVWCALRGKMFQIPSCATKRMMVSKVTEVRWNPTLT